MLLTILLIVIAICVIFALREVLAVVAIIISLLIFAPEKLLEGLTEAAMEIGFWVFIGLIGCLFSKK